MLVTRRLLSSTLSLLLLLQNTLNEVYESILFLFQQTSTYPLLPSDLPLKEGRWVGEGGGEDSMAGRVPWGRLDPRGGLLHLGRGAGTDPAV